METFLSGEIFNNVWFLLLISLWVLPWKGFALWRAAQRSHKKWFIALLILNTLAILDILYIFYFSKKCDNCDLQKVEGVEEAEPEKVEGFEPEKQTE
jgi:hypothetical protein